MDKGVLRWLRAPGGLTRQFSARRCLPRAGAQASARPGWFLFFRRAAAQHQKPRYEGLKGLCVEFAMESALQPFV
jgi:hypothetical protein